MVDYRTGRRYVELLVHQPPQFRGWMRIYTDRVVAVVELERRASTIGWCNTPVVDREHATWLDILLPARDVRAMLEQA